MVKIIIAIVISICAIITPLKIDVVSADTKAFNYSINTPSGTANDSNIFSKLSSFYVAYNGSWQFIQDFYNNSTFVFNGIQTNSLVSSTSTSLYPWTYILWFNDYIPAGYPLTIVTNVNMARPFNQPNFVVNWQKGDTDEYYSTELIFNEELTNSNKLAFNNTQDEYYYYYYTTVCPFPSKHFDFTFGAMSAFTIDLNEGGTKTFNNFGVVSMFQGIGDTRQIYDQGYDSGYSSGYNSGVSDGISTANNTINTDSASYYAGYDAGASSSATLYGVFSKVIEAPINVFLNTFDFEIFGVNVSSFILSIITLCFIAVFIKLIF